MAKSLYNLKSDYGTFRVEWKWTQTISSNLWFHHLFSKHLARFERLIKMLSVGWELYQNYTISTFVVSIFLHLTSHSSYKGTQWKANKFPPLWSRPGITSNGWAAKTTSTFKLSCNWEQPLRTDWKSGRARCEATASLQRQKAFCRF